jgi:FlaA1/EpsC-like NDP-sugar epimerase
MTYASFNLLASTKFPAHSVRRSTGVLARVGRGRLVIPVVLAAATEFLFVAVAAYFAGVLYHRLILLDSPDADRYIQQSLLISTLQVLVSIGLRHYSRILAQPRHVFLWSGVSDVFLVFSFFLSAIFLLKISEDYSRATLIIQAVSVVFAVLCTRTLWFSLLQRAIASGLIDAMRIILIGDAGHCLDFSARAMATGIRTIRSFDFPMVRTDCSAPARPDAIQALRDARELITECRPIRADDVVILTSEADVSSALALASALSDLPVDVQVVPVGSIDLMAVSRITQFGNMVTMRIFQSPLTAFNRAIKRAFDVRGVRRADLVIFPSPQRQAWHYRLGAGQRVPWRHRYPREDAASCRA